MGRKIKKKRKKIKKIMKVKRPKKWMIEIWEENDQWHEKYIELFPITTENKEAMKVTIPIINSIYKNADLIDFEVKEIKMEGMMGLLMTMTAKSLVPFANQLLGEFMIMSELGDITLRDMFVILIQSLI